MSDILKIKNLNKKFGTNHVINNLNLSVKRGSIFGFIGKNGAGKTTTMKMILGFLKFDSGEINVFNELVTFGNSKTNKYIGYLPDVPEFYNYMTPKEYLKLCGQICCLNSDFITKKSYELLNLVGLSSVNKKISGFSRGMKQRLGIAQALINEPKLLICDEPTSALDPTGRKEILDILNSIKNTTTIIFSTHILSDVEKICDTIGVLDKGKLVLEGNLNYIKNSYRQDKILIQVSNSNDLNFLLENLKFVPSITNIHSNNNNILYINLTDLKKTSLKILDLISKNNIYLLKYEICEPTLENLFLEATL